MAKREAEGGEGEQHFGAVTGVIVRRSCARL